MPGKFFASRWHGVSYGPFAPDSKRNVKADFAHMAALGFNCARLYELPDQHTLDTAAAHGLKLLCGIPWAEHIDFLSDADAWEDVRRRVANGAAFLGRQEAVAAILIGNEIEKTLVRWMRPHRVRAALEELVEIARQHAPRALISYATYPSTEYLVPRNADFLAVNVYLEQRAALTRYLARLQNLAGNKPLVITEFGLNTAAHDEAAQVETLRWFHEETLAAGCAGAVWFSYTDEWFRGGREVTDWRFGLVTRERQERPACETARQLPLKPAPPPNPPRISVVVCTRNGSRTLGECLESLKSLNYPDYEVLVIDDGSTDASAEIAKALPFVKYHHQKPAGLSVARNRGAELATGSIVAYTDDDCIAHADWLLYLSHAFDDERVIAAGGPNIPPPPRNRVERVVAAAPGAPAHVLLSDTEAEHLPGCNLAIRKDALAQIGGFTDEFTTAGDDVDICWRLRAHGGKGSLCFVPGAMVWHHRRFTIRAYLRQQRGYGFAEALLMAAHPRRFGPLGGARWRGGIYGDRLPSDDPDEGSIYHGPFGLGAFQTIYASNTGFRWWDWFTGVIWVALAVLMLVVKLPALAAALLFFAIWAAWRISARNARAASLRGALDRALLLLLSFLQPVVREFARLRGMIIYTARPTWRPHLPDILPPVKPRKITIRLATLRFWSESGRDRYQLIEAMRHQLVHERRLFRQDDGWRWFDLELNPQNDLSCSLLTVTEYHGGGRCLTRVRCMLRLRRGLVWNVVLWLAFAAVLATLPLPIGLLGLIGGGATLVLIPVALHLIRRDLITLTQTAAQSVELSVVSAAKPRSTEPLA
ncbi:MAG: glycosyltransferase [Verrucomicrobiaceae bacterium]|nr:glycosyltransferase [Verrucomicrobiaceae bacterium]